MLDLDRILVATRNDVVRCSFALCDEAGDKQPKRAGKGRRRESPPDAKRYRLSRDQILTIVLLLGLIALFLWDRLRYDLVALLALLAAVGAGIVPADKAFNGFSNPILPLIAAALIVSVAIGQSGAIEVLLRYLNSVMRSKSREPSSS